MSIRLPEELWQAAEVQQRERVMEEPFVGAIDDVLRDENGNELRGKILVEDVWRLLRIPTGQRNQYNNTRIGQAMKELGWAKKSLRLAGAKEGGAKDNRRNYYVKGDEPYRQILIMVDDENRSAVPSASYDDYKPSRTNREFLDKHDKITGGAY